MQHERKYKLRYHLLIILLICAALYVLFFVSLGWITNHGDEMKVPPLTGKDLKVAVAELEKQGFEVRIDSTYEPEKKPLVVLGQQPDAGAVVKNGRTLYLTVNKIEPPKTAMPNLIGLSYRSAVAILKSNRLIMGDTSYTPDIAKGTILDQMMKGQKIKPGQLIPQGSRIDLVIGDGLGDTELNVPDVVEQPYEIAMAMLSGYGFVVNVTTDGDISDTAAAVVIKQQPNAFNELQLENRLRVGDQVDIVIKQNPAPEDFQHSPSPASSPDTTGKDPQTH